MAIVKKVILPEEEINELHAKWLLLDGFKQVSNIILKNSNISKELYEKVTSDYIQYNTEYELTRQYIVNKYKDNNCINYEINYFTKEIVFYN